MNGGTLRELIEFIGPLPEDLIKHITS